LGFVALGCVVEVGGSRALIWMSGLSGCRCVGYIGRVLGLSTGWGCWMVVAVGSAPWSRVLFIIDPTSLCRGQLWFAFVDPFGKRTKIAHLNSIDSSITARKRPSKALSPIHAI